MEFDLLCKEIYVYPNVFIFSFHLYIVDLDLKYYVNLKISLLMLVNLDVTLYRQLKLVCANVCSG